MDKNMEKRLRKLAVRLDDLAADLDPYDYESNTAYHEQLLTSDPLNVIDQLIDIANELLQQVRQA